MLGIEPSTFVSKIDILTTTPIVLNESSKRLIRLRAHCSKRLGSVILIISLMKCTKFNKMK